MTAKLILIYSFFHSCQTHTLRSIQSFELIFVLSFRESRPLKGSRGSLGSSPKLDSDDGGSLNDYADVDPGKFTEDGSFVGAYINTNDRKK